MQFNVFLPKETEHGKVPAVYFLAGLTCTEDNFAQKSGAFGPAAREGLVIICPDTSPRKVNIEGEDDDYDFGSGAGFYINATTPKWSKHYKMYDYIVNELPSVVAELPIDPKRVSISGHSMSVSAFAPIANPTNCPWGQKAFSGYLGEDNKEAWKEHDACELLSSTVDKTAKLDVLVDVGTSDNFLEKQLLLPNLEKAFKENGHDGQLKLRYQQGYDHSYYFISTFIDDHIRHHAKYLK
ncbi:hypothetical protein BZG36_01224 [Bifiguratus adelaidae]|uniref:S-formylglutathione hydrolase n=1 Tax=Bifiguratus adelaidae TaxID=1938954 RepID=A0A261Y5R0_9FUNG|nr:hypothetical protein BZG36_01224 [Bifiguratus adelaidae]